MFWRRKPVLKTNVYTGDPDYRSPMLMARTEMAVHELRIATKTLQLLVEGLVDEAQVEAQQEEKRWHHR